MPLGTVGETAFSLDNKQLAVAIKSGPVRIELSSVPDMALIKSACERLLHNLTPEK
jgi:hypothetical protein